LRIAAKQRMASSHDILIGHGSMSGLSKTGGAGRKPDFYFSRVKLWILASA